MSEVTTHNLGTTALTPSAPRARRPRTGRRLGDPTSSRPGFPRAPHKPCVTHSQVPEILGLTGPLRMYKVGEFGGCPAAFFLPRRAWGASPCCLA